MDTPLVRRLLAEFAGTAMLCLFGIGAAVSVAAADAGGPGLLIVALAHGLALAVAIYAFGSVSGGHYNPTVTFALAARGRFSWREVPAYVAAQLVGGIVGAALVYAAYAGTATAAGLGATTFGDGVGYGQALVAEAIGAFILVTAVFALAVAPGAPKGVHGFGIGLALATQIMVFGPLTGASVNLARTLGPDAILSLAGESAAWSQLLVYLVGPLVGGVAAAFLCDRIMIRRTVASGRTHRARRDRPGLTWMTTGHRCHGTPASPAPCEPPPPSVGHSNPPFRHRGTTASPPAGSPARRPPTSRGMG